MMPGRFINRVYQINDRFTAMVDHAEPSKAIPDF